MREDLKELCEAMIEPTRQRWITWERSVGCRSYTHYAPSKYRIVVKGDHTWGCKEVYDLCICAPSGHLVERVENSTEPVLRELFAACRASDAIVKQVIDEIQAELNAIKIIDP